MSVEVAVLRTERLVLRPFVRSDAEAVVALAGERAIADTTENIPHPYHLPMAHEWIAGHEPARLEGHTVCWAIVDGNSQELRGAISLRLLRYETADLGYWLGKYCWGQGLMTEAGLAVVKYARDSLGLYRLQGRHLERNPASGKVMQKLGFQIEGQQSGAVLKWGKREDMVSLGLILG